jgi:hypothetical protein
MPLPAGNGLVADEKLGPDEESGARLRAIPHGTRREGINVHRRTLLAMTEDIRGWRVCQGAYVRTRTSRGRPAGSALTGPCNPLVRSVRACLTRILAAVR